MMAYGGAGQVLNRLETIDSTVTEALRLCVGSLTLREVKHSSSVPLARKASSSSSNHNRWVRAGDQVCIYPVLTHMDGDIFHAPEEFRYNRFMPSRGAGAGAGAGAGLPQPSQPTFLQKWGQGA